jgi:hypothetical protein
MIGTSRAKAQINAHEMVRSGKKLPDTAVETLTSWPLDSSRNKGGVLRCRL